MDGTRRYAHNRNTTQKTLTSKPVGHVGSSVLKKAETVVFIEKEDNKHCKCEYSRNMPFNDIHFDVNSDWLPFEIDQ
jgi:hypothetical protein